MEPGASKKKREWRWSGVETGRLLYEPGNWGDVLKGTWAVTLVEFLIRGRKALSYLDPFAGAPTYPLSEAARLRAGRLPESLLKERLQPFLEARQWPSTASLVQQACEANGVPPRLQLFDVDERKRSEWPDDTLLGCSSAEQSLEDVEPGALDLILIDPYDFVHHWGKWLPQLQRFEQELVLIYLYNKTPRGSGHEDQYRRFRRGLEEESQGNRGWLLGRLPSDAVAPRAFHEVWLLGGRSLLAELREPLKKNTTALAEVQGCHGKIAGFEGS
ncbi:MAG: hypothetical protein V3T77_04380 [Planctomycetota bacterium]